MQRNWGVTYPINNLRSGGGASHPLLPLIEAELEAMVPSVEDPSSMGFTRVSAGECACRHLEWGRVVVRS
jgi:hypothetical protein